MNWGIFWVAIGEVFVVPIPAISGAIAGAIAGAIVGAIAGINFFVSISGYTVGTRDKEPEPGCGMVIVGVMGGAIIGAAGGAIAGAVVNAIVETIGWWPGGAISGAILGTTGGLIATTIDKNTERGADKPSGPGCVISGAILGTGSMAFCGGFPNNATELAGGALFGIIGGGIWWGNCWGNCWGVY